MMRIARNLMNTRPAETLRARMRKAQCHVNFLLAQEEDENMAFLVASFSLGLLGIIVTLMVGRKSQDPPENWTLTTAFKPMASTKEVCKI
jgi:hypothetical protein